MTDKMREAFERDHGTLSDDKDMQKYFARHECAMRWAWQAAQSEQSAELERLRKDAELGRVIREKYSGMKTSTSKRFLEAIGVELDEDLAWTSYTLETLLGIDAAIQRAEANIAPDPYTGGAAPDPDMAHAAHCSDSDCARCAAIDAAIAAEGEKK